MIDNLDDWDDESREFLEYTFANDIIFPGTDSELFRKWKRERDVAELERDIRSGKPMMGKNE